MDECSVCVDYKTEKYTVNIHYGDFKMSLKRITEYEANSSTS